MNVSPNLHALNDTELAYMIRRHTGLVVKKLVTKERLIQLVETGATPLPEEIASTSESRKKLQLFVQQNWSWINSQLPCKGENMGRCTIYPCAEGRHIDCLLAAGPHMRMM